MSAALAETRILHERAVDTSEQAAGAGAFSTDSNPATRHIFDRPPDLSPVDTILQELETSLYHGLWSAENMGGVRLFLGIPLFK